MENIKMRVFKYLSLIPQVKLSVTLAFALALFVTPMPSSAGGIHSGGGSGIATYRPGAPMTPENLLSVESLALFKARAEGKFPAPNSNIFDLLDQKLDTGLAFKQIRKMLQAASPEFFLQFALADEKFSAALERAEKKHEASKEVTDDGSPVNAPLDLIHDYGILKPLAENQKLVQIIRRTGDQFDIDYALWSKLKTPLDRIDLRLHEGGYAVSWQRDSVRVQKFQLYVLEHYLRREPMSKEEFGRLAKSEWGFVQPASSPAQISIPGVRVVESNERPWSEGAGAEVMPGLPMESREGLQCGWLNIDASSSEIGSTVPFLYWDGGKGKTSHVSLSEKERGIYRALKSEGERAIRAKLNPLMESYLMNYPAVVCFEKSWLGPRKMKYVEIRLVRDAKKLRLDWEDVISYSKIDREISQVLSQKITEAFHKLSNETSRPTMNNVATRIKSEVARLEDLVMKMDLPSSYQRRILDEIYTYASAEARSILHIIPVGASYSDELQGLSLDLAMKSTANAQNEEAEFARMNPNIIRPPDVVLMGSSLIKKVDKEIAGSFAAYLD